MKKSIAQLRRSYEKAKLTEDSVLGNPYDQFQFWFDQNLKVNKEDPTAMALATVDKKGKPTNRIVLLKEFSQEGGFSFYTNYDSRKAKQIKDNPNASLLFYWPQLERQIRIEGKIKKLSLAFLFKILAALKKAKNVMANVFAAWLEKKPYFPPV